MPKSRPNPTAPIATQPTGWANTLLICRKCSKKLGGGFGPDGDEKLGKAVRHALRGTAQRGRLGVIEVPCFGICPKNAVTVLRGDTPDTFLIVASGTPVEGLVAPRSSQIL